jgi:hypothetical protein
MRIGPKQTLSVYPPLLLIPIPTTAPPVPNRLHRCAPPQSLPTRGRAHPPNSELLVRARRGATRRCSWRGRAGQSSSPRGAREARRCSRCGGKRLPPRPRAEVAWSHGRRLDADRPSPPPARRPSGIHPPSAASAAAPSNLAHAEPRSQHPDGALLRR